MLRLVSLVVVPDGMCVPILVWTALVRKLNKIFDLITQTIKILHGIYCMIFKNMCFWCDTNSIFMTGLHGGSTKISCLSDHFWCKVCIKLYAWSKFPLPVVSTNYKINLHDWFIFGCLLTYYTGYIKDEKIVSLYILEVHIPLFHTLILLIFICSVLCLHIPCS